MTDFNKLRPGDRCPVCNGPLLDIGVAAPRMVCKERECDRGGTTRTAVEFDDETTEEFITTPWGPVKLSQAQAMDLHAFKSPDCGNYDPELFPSPFGAYHCRTCGVCF